MRVLQVGPAIGLDANRAGSPGGVRVLTGGAGHNSAHERSDGITRLNDSRGPVGRSSTGLFNGNCVQVSEPWGQEAFT